MDCGYIEITPENKPLIESCYEARTEKELPVLVQYIDRNKLPPPKATHLDIILYSREQIIKENEAMGNEVRGTRIALTLDPFYPHCSSIIHIPSHRSPIRTPLGALSAWRASCVTMSCPCSPSPSCATAWARNTAAAGCRWILTSTPSRWRSGRSTLRWSKQCLLWAGILHS